jgi:hypothetical protein
LNELASNEQLFMIYPNPNKGAFTVKGETQLDLKLVNQLGQVIRTIKLEEQDAYYVSIEALPSGIYFLVGQTGKQTTSARIVVTN